MSQISLKSLSGITSITTPAGVDNVFTVHTNDTTERFRVDQTGNLNIAGIITATSFSGTVSNASGATGDFSIADKIVHTGDTNTAIRFPAVDTITAETSGLERLRIHSTGVVMINTTNSSSRNLNLKGTFGILSTNQTGVIDMSVTDAGEASIGPYVAGGSTLILKTNPSGSGVAERLRITSTGDLKFSTSTRTGNVNSICSGGGNSIDLNGSEYLYFRTAGSERLRIESDGKVGIGTNNPSQMLTVGGTILKTRSDSGVGLIYLQNDGSQNGQIIVNQNGGVTRVKLDSAGSSYITGGNLALGNTLAAKKFHISTTGNQKILVDPNYNNNSGGSSNSEADANNIVESILIRTSFGSNAASQTNAGHKWGIKFQGYNGNDFTQAISKCAGVFAVSEDEAGGYNRNVGLTFHTSPYNTAHREVMRINTNGIVTKPYQYMFTVETNGVSKNASWSKITGLTPDANQCTGVSDGTNWSNSTQRFTAPVAGIYHFFVGGWAVSSSNGSRYAYTFKHTNGNYYNYIGGGNYCLVDSPMDGFSRTIKLSAGEWVELWGYSSVATTWGGGHRFFWGGYLLG